MMGEAAHLIAVRKQREGQRRPGNNKPFKYHSPTRNTLLPARPNFLIFYSARTDEWIG